jgi:hypothetical protein
VLDVAGDGGRVGETAADARRDRTTRAARRVDLRDPGLLVVGQLEAVGAEELDAVVPDRVVRGGQHHAGTRGRAAGEVGDTRRGQHPDGDGVTTGGGDAGDHRRLEHVARPARVAPDEDRGPLLALLVQHGDERAPERERDLGGQVDVRLAADPVGAEADGGSRSGATAGDAMASAAGPLTTPSRRPCRG